MNGTNPSDSLKSEGVKAAADIAKQMITLSTGAVAFTVTFLDKFTAHAAGEAISLPWALFVAWGCFGASIIFSVWTLMGITGTLLSGNVVDSKSKNVSIPAILMILAFLAAVAAMIITGILLSIS